MYTFSAEGAFAVQLGEETVTSLNFQTLIPENIDGRPTDTGADLTVTGKIRSTAEGTLAADETIKLAQWASLTSGDDALAYQKATGIAVAGGQTLRDYTLGNAFIVSYKEELNISSGVGEFTLHLRQKKDLMENVQISGGYGL